MRGKKLLFPTLLLFTIIALIFRLFTRTTSANHIADMTEYDAIDAYVEAQIKRLNIPGGSVAIVEGEEIVHFSNFGRARPNGETPSPQTPFFIGSLTKSVTSLAVMQLVEVGKVDLDEPIQTYLPWFRVADPDVSAQITVRHLLNQTSGLSTSSGWIPLADFDDSLDAGERQARALSSLAVSHPIGSKFEYTNSNYNLLGLIIEATSGESYADYVQNYIFSPLDMQHSYHSQEIAKQNQLAVGHQMWFGFPKAVPQMEVPVGSLPSGQLISTSEDMGHYMISLLNNGHYQEKQIISETSINQMHDGIAEDQMSFSPAKYGMGWYVGEVEGSRAVWHSGSTPDFASYMALLPEQNKGIVLLFNADHFLMVPQLTEVGTNITTLLAGGQPAPLRLGFLHWIQRGLLLIPIIQAVGVSMTLWFLHHRQKQPLSRPRGIRNKWGLFVLIPLILNLLLSLTLIPLFSAMRGFWMLFMPDYAWIAMISGSFAAAWAFLRTGLLLQRLHKRT